MRVGLLVVAVLLGSCAHPSESSSPMPTSTPTSTPTPTTPTPVSTPRPADAKPQLWFGGDVNLGDGGHHVFDGLAPSLRGIAGVVNLEGPVAPSQPAGEGLKLFNAPGALSELHSLGVIAVGIANNHAHDTGEQGPTQTLRAVTDAGFHAAGGPAGPALLEVNGLKIAVSAHDLEHGVPRELSRELAEARVHADRLVATFHVTGPASYLPTKELRAAVEVALAAGADVVIAHGSHMLGPLERRGRAVIAWGLGNVVFACDCTDESDALLLELSFTSDRTLAWAVPIDAGLRGGPAQLSSDSKGTFDLLVGLGSKGLTLLPDGRVQF